VSCSGTPPHLARRRSPGIEPATFLLPDNWRVTSPVVWQQEGCWFIFVQLESYLSSCTNINKAIDPKVSIEVPAPWTAIHHALNQTFQRHYCLCPWWSPELSYSCGLVARRFAALAYWDVGFLWTHCYTTAIHFTFSVWCHNVPGRRVLFRPLGNFTCPGRHRKTSANSPLPYSLSNNWWLCDSECRTAQRWMNDDLNSYENFYQRHADRWVDVNIVGGLPQM